MKGHEAGSINSIVKSRKPFQTVVNCCYKQIAPVVVKYCWNDRVKTGSKRKTEESCDWKKYILPLPAFESLSRAPMIRELKREAGETEVRSQRAES